MSGIGNFLTGALAPTASIVSSQLAYNAAKAQNQAANQYASQAADIAREQAKAAQKQLDLAWDQWNKYQQVYTPLEQAAASEAMADLAMYRPLKQAQAGAAMTDLQLNETLKRAGVDQALSTMARLGPLQDQLAKDALAGVTPNERAAASQAAADVRQSFANTRAKQGRSAAGLGLDPTRLAWMERPTDLAEAAAEAAARTQARRQERDSAAAQTQALRQDALGLARNLPNLPGQVRVATDVDIPQGDLGSVQRMFSSGQTGMNQAVNSLLSVSRGLPSNPVFPWGSVLGGAGGIYGQVSKQF